jgi:non-ribosomal peptide synthetase component F
MNVVEPILAQVRAAPDAPAVVNAEGTLTYAELERAVSSTAQRWRAGIANPRRIGEMAPHRARAQHHGAMSR